MAHIGQQSAKQLQTHKQMNSEALSKLSEQVAFKEVQADSEAQLRKHTIAHTRALHAAKASFDIERTQQQSLHEQALRVKLLS